jgi:hypothetical protein
MFPSSKLSRPSLGQTQCLTEYVQEFLWGEGVNRPECEVDHSPPSRAKVQMELLFFCTYISSLHGMERGQFFIIVTKLGPNPLTVPLYLAIKHFSRLVHPYFVTCRLFYLPQTTNQFAYICVYCQISVFYRFIYKY